VQVIKGDIDNSLHLTSTPFAAVLNILPIFGPFFSPLKWQFTGDTNFRGKAIFNLSYPLRVTHT
jgi:hypothetical protein